MWRDLFRDLIREFGVRFLGAILSFLPPAALIKAYGVEFVTKQHQVPGWVIIAAIAMMGPLLLIGIVHYQRRHRSARQVQNLSAVPEGYPRSLHWSPGGRGHLPVMHVVGDFVITNASNTRLIVPRTILVLSYTFMRFPRRRVVGPGVWDPIEVRSIKKDRLIWTVERPMRKAGETLNARVCFIDQFNREYWAPWLEWVSTK